jgi:hypothetical protein
MARKFTDDDRHKDVYTAGGARIGTIRDVNNDRATVEHREDDESLTEKVKDWLSWNDDDTEHELRSEHVESYEEDRVRLRDRP